MFVIDFQVFKDIGNLLVWVVNVLGFSEQLLKVGKPGGYPLFWAVSRDLTLFALLPSRDLINDALGLTILLCPKSFLY